MMSGAISSGSLVAIGISAIFILLPGWVAWKYISMVRHNDEHSREGFAHAYKIFAHFVTAFLIIFFLVMAAIGVFSIFSGAVGAGLTAIGLGALEAIIGILINLHYLKVVKTYAEHADEHHGYEKH